MTVHEMMDRVNNIGQRIKALNAQELNAAREKNIERLNSIYLRLRQLKFVRPVHFLLQSRKWEHL